MCLCKCGTEWWHSKLPKKSYEILMHFECCHSWFYACIIIGCHRKLHQKSAQFSFCIFHIQLFMMTYTCGPMFSLWLANCFCCYIMHLILVVRFMLMILCQPHADIFINMSCLCLMIIDYCVNIAGTGKYLTCRVCNWLPGGINIFRIP